MSHTPQKQPLTRRQMLFGMGIIGVGIVGCSCGGLGALSVMAWQASREQQPEPTIIVAQPTASPTAPPTFEIISRDVWNPAPPNHNASNESGFYSPLNPAGWRIYDEPLHEQYQTVVIHHAAFWENTDAETLAEIVSLHRGERRGWADVAYHFLIGRTGRIYAGRDMNVRGVHVGGANSGSLGICLLGDFTRQTVTSDQLLSTQKLVEWTSQQLHLTHIAGHRDFNPGTQCPGDNLAQYIEPLAQQNNLTVGTDGYIGPVASICGCCDCTI